MHLFPKCQNNNVQVIACTWKGLSGFVKFSELGSSCTWPRNKPQKEDTVPLKACILRMRGRGRKAGRHIHRSHYVILRGRNLVLACLMEVCEQACLSL